MKNHVKPGKMMTCVAASGGVSAGDLVFVGSMFGIAATSALEGEEYELATGDVWELPKTSAQAWTVGAVIYGTSAGIATTVSTDNTKIGVAAAIAANPSGTGWVRLNASF